MPEKYRLHYRHTWNLGNYESEGAEIERDFDGSVSSDVAYNALKAELLTAREQSSPKGTTPKPALVTNKPNQTLNPITEAQKKFLLQIIEDKNIPIEEINARIQKTFNIGDVNKLTRQQASALIDTLKKGQ